MASDRRQKVGRVIAKSWSDAAFKKRLMTNPKAVFDEFGIEYPANLDVQVVENTDKKRYFVIPAAPSDKELSAADLDKVAGANNWM
jgi:Nitrile hydratase, alpha chain